MAIVGSRFYNDGQIGQSFESIASMFAPPSASDLAGYSTAALNQQKRDHLGKLFSAGADPSEQASLIGVQNYGQTPKGFTYQVDQDNLTSRANNRETAQFSTIGDMYGPLNQGQVRPALPVAQTDFMGLPAMPAVQGAPKPLSESEFKAGELERLLAAGTITDDDIARDFTSGVNVEEVIGPDGLPMFASRDAAIGMQPAPKTPSTTVTVGAGEKSFDVETGKLFAKRYDELSGQANVAQDMLGMLSAAENALASGVYTGLGGDQLLDLQRLGTALGVDNADEVAGGELIRAIQNRMALLMRNPESGMGMPGAVSDRDITFLKAAQPGLGRSEEGNRQLIGMLAAMERRKIEIANLADAYVQENGRLDVGFNQKVREYAKANPLFPDPASAGTPGGASGVASGDVYAVNPQTGERVVYREGQWRLVE